MVVKAGQSFLFFRQISWFLGNNGALSKFWYQILHKLVLRNYKKSQSAEANFKITALATLS